MQSNIMLDIPAGSPPQAASKSKALPHHLDIIQLLENQVQFFHCARAEGSSWIVFHWQCLKQTTEDRKNHRSGSDLALWKRDATRSHQPAWLPWLQERLIATWGWLKNINLQKCMDTCTHCQIWVAWFHLFWAKARLLAPTAIVLIFLGYGWVTSCWRLVFFNNGCHHESHPVPKILWLFWGCLTWMGDEYDASHSFII